MITRKIYGPPGTGKTYTLLQHFEKELETVKPEKLGFVTFTRAARAEVLSRASLNEDELPFVKTLHATCYRALKIDQSQLLTRADTVNFGRTIGVYLTGFMPDLFSLEAVTDRYQAPTKADRLLQLNHLGRHRGLKLKETLKDAPQELDFKYARWFTQSYRDWKVANGKLDYTDLLTEFLDRGEVLDLETLFVDEAQDLSWLQWRVVNKLSDRCQRLYLAGDDDQAIFTWAGASASMFNLVTADETRVLPQSYRLPRQVFEISQRIIHQVRVRQEKEFYPRDADGEYKPIGQLGLNHVSQGSTLVLYRNYHRGTALSLKLEDLGVPFGGANSTLSNPDVRLVLQGWQNVQKNNPIPMPQARAMVDHAAPIYLAEGARVKVEPRTGEISATSLFKETAFTDDWHRVLPKLPRLAYLQRTVNKFSMDEMLNPKINLLSIHQSKGREADTVCLDLEMARRTYEAYTISPDDEHRVQYVAVTRAKERLYTMLPTESMAYIL